MQLLVFAKTSLESSINREKIDMSTENTGLFHILPNKGGISVSFNVDDTKFTCISCHLAAHEGVTKCAIRNDSTVEILNGLRSRGDDFDPSQKAHHTFWMGDLNYRITFDTAMPSHSDTTSPSFSSKGQDDFTPPLPPSPHVANAASMTPSPPPPSTKARKSIGELFSRGNKMSLFAQTKKMAHQTHEELEEDPDESFVSDHPDR